ncbi:hypothetical protein PUNSTDRAFT_142483 [Punctularia strigosozonata HHB-11173 SS5]|uniref:uncharacterized protein n=1 Tax=Punctularia strigosozonata (strain HHB-11173) TaxID=741275 RepID=UPI00044166AF|nr:uncharacterized protein PUNSTDRAFT_142483 [Punctularia strigosozonata HHB-11173 SS5]EIN10473.1 hypothetical protein PUNSTDRAFT_142483 [Punctularia strigosozonata HHB-11173 SS5]
MAQDDSRAIAWLVMWVWPSHFGLPLLAAICLLSGTVTRHPLFLNLIITEILAGLSNSILLYTGHWRATGPQPSVNVCLFQAGLGNGEASMTAAASFALAYQVFISVRGAIRGHRAHTNGANVIGLLILPYALFVIFAVSTIVVGGHKLEFVVRNSFLPYCQYTGKTATTVAATFAGILTCGTLLMEAWIIFYLYQQRRALRKAGIKNLLMADTSLRIIAFTGLMVMALLLILIGFTTPMSAVPDLVMCTMGTFLVLVFGTQRDILHVILRRDRTQSPSEGSTLKFNNTASQALSSIYENTIIVQADEKRARSPTGTGGSWEP